MPEESKRAKMRWPDGEGGVWVEFPDATCLKVDPYEGTKPEYYYRLQVMGETGAGYKYYASYNYHRVVQRAFDELAEKQHALMAIQLHFRKLPGEGNTKYWIVSDVSGALVDSRNDFDVSEAGEARVEDRTSTTPGQGAGQPPPPPQDGQQPAQQPQQPPQQPGTPPPPPQAAPPPQNQPQEPQEPPPGHPAAMENGSSSNGNGSVDTETLYFHKWAHLLKAFKLAEALLTTPDVLSVQYGPREIQATALYLAIDLGKKPPTDQMITDAKEAAELWKQDKLREEGEKNPSQVTGPTDPVLPGQDPHGPAKPVDGAAPPPGPNPNDDLP
tara:strand:- start:2662 stop:3645 length:984 start_codon:yes stop_codon:yes gene_type:complete